ncbi:transposase [Haloferax sp. Atlit-10N]|uniref:IS1341-type transposase ISHgi9 n=1 Tax=Haloferax gibbonsii TaxID=35746 RepID=A0A871BI63_HALGI|nr:MULTISPECIES: RNA-guided endonuclease TnpB family protein [Haloferax]QOS12692.1 IS1341-type transposase ISHgi9 [Haloferax gibbonsii]RDZ44845.1 transposase [Haloferax sp. Atlit-16N]RDZ52675.1 transposase [Haloferax sp. Atlit-4N]RDZ59376.1 transposase [Haloferax sp. Atlit-10N]
MEVRRTAPVKLVVPDERREDLHESARQFLHCANRAAEFCWSDRSYTECVTVNTTTRDALYDELRVETNLTANLVQEAIRRGVEAVKGCVERWKNGKRVSQPEFTSWSMLYDKRSATFYRNKVSLSTVNGRVECEFELPSDSPTPYEQYVLSEEFEFRASTLQYDAVDDEFYFHITTRKYDSERDGEPSEVSADTEHQTVLGIDLGVSSLAVSSTGRFWQGDDYDHWCREFEKRRGEMQQRGTQAAHNALLRLGKREEAWRKQYIHTVANEIITEAVEHDCDVIVFEELTDIRERLPQAKWHHIWAFRRLYEYVSYKAPERGVSVEQVGPNHTSQRCSRTDCGFTHEDNRHGEYFECLKCGYEVNADYNAAKNIGVRYVRKETHKLRSSPKSGSGDAPVDVRLNGGMLNGESHQPLAGD